MTGRPFLHRSHAGVLLARALDRYRGDPDVTVLGLARGGVPVASAVAAALGSPLDVYLVRQLGLPENPEVALGALAEPDVKILNSAVISDLGVPAAVVELVTAREHEALLRRQQLYRAGRPPVALGGRTVIVVDDGLATGASMEAAIRGIRTQNPARVIVAVPVASRFALLRIRPLADEVVCLEAPMYFEYVGQWYADFGETTDAEVIALLAAAQAGSVSS